MYRMQLMANAVQVFLFFLFFFIISFSNEYNHSKETSKQT